MKSQIFNERAVLLVLLLFCIQASIIAHLSIFQCIGYVLTQLFIILVPGLALHDVLKTNNADGLSRIFTSYAMGYALSIFFYFLFLLFGIQSYIPYFYFPFVLLCLFVLIRNRQTSVAACGESLWMVSAFLTVALLIGTYGCQCDHLSPLYHENLFAWGDLNYFERNTVAATMRYPLPDLSISGVTVHYHYFSSLHGAFMHYITKIEIFDLCYMAYLEYLFLLVGAAYVLSASMLNNKWLVYLCIIFIVFSAGFEDKTDFYYSKTFLCSFGMTEALAMGMYCFCDYYHQFRKKNVYIPQLLLGLLLFATCLGLKALVGCIVLAGVGMGSLWQMFHKQYKNALLMGVSYLLTFICIYFTFLHKSQVEPGSTRSLTLSATDTIFHSGYFEHFYNSLSQHFCFPLIPYLATLIYYLLLALFPALLLLLFVLFYRRGNFLQVFKDSANTIFITMFSVGLLLGLLVSQVGLSQTYFIRAGLPFFFVLLLRIIETTRVSRIAVLCISIIACLGTYKSFRLLLPICYNGANKVCTVNKETYDFGGLTKNELLGLRWVRDNVDRNAIIATNKMIEDENDELGRSRSFATSTYSEHQVYLEGYEFSSISKVESSRRYNLMKRVFNGDDEALSIIKMEQVSHIVQFKSIKVNKTIKGEKIFENEDLIVYKI